MHSDITDLRAFYETRRGRQVKRLLRSKVAGLWPEVRGLRILGIGYPVPLLRPYLAQAAQVVVAMPASQGVIGWPREGPFTTVLVDEQQLPFADRTFDAVVLLHAVEGCESLRGLLAECWRVLAPQGNILAIVPNRLGLWARAEGTPFGQGHPYTMRQLKMLLAHNRFTPMKYERALYMPPVTHGLGLRIASWCEAAGPRLWYNFSGVVMIYATKQIYNVRPTAPVTHGKALLGINQPVAAANRTTVSAQGSTCFLRHRGDNFLADSV